LGVIYFPFEFHVQLTPRLDHVDSGENQERSVKKIVATVGVFQATGGSDGSPANEDEIVTSTRLQTKDQFMINDTAFPIPIPAAGFSYSYWLTGYLKITGGTFTKINNIQLWSDGDVTWEFGTNGELRIGNRDAGDIGFTMDGEYEVATGVEGESGDEIEHATNGHSFYSGQTVKTKNIEDWVTGTKAVIDSGDHTIAEMCKAFLLQTKVDTAANGAVQGEQADETIYLSYDEI